MLVFRTTQSPFISEGTLDTHFDNCGQEFRVVVEKVRDHIYVDVLVTGVEGIDEVRNQNQDPSVHFDKGG